MTMKELESVFRDATIMCLGYDKDDDSEEVQQRVRKSWPQSDIGNSDWQRDENVVFLHIIPTDDNMTHTENVSYQYDDEQDQHREVVEYHTLYQITWVCYGPDAHDDAQKIRVGILRDAIRIFLQKHRIGIQPHIRDPQRFPEQEENGDWWERYDLTALFYEKGFMKFDSEYIENVPTIFIR